MIDGLRIDACWLMIKRLTAKRGGGFAALRRVGYFTVYIHIYIHSHTDIHIHIRKRIRTYIHIRIHIRIQRPGQPDNQISGRLAKGLKALDVAQRGMVWVWIS